MEQCEPDGTCSLCWKCDVSIQLYGDGYLGKERVIWDGVPVGAGVVLSGVGILRGKDGS